MNGTIRGHDNSFSDKGRKIINRKSNSDFVNYSFDFAVLDISKENEEFNWEWINFRRDKSKTLEETLVKAPSAWKYWV